MIYLDKVSKKYRAGDVGLFEVTLSISQGEFVTIVGRSGAGKTSLLKILLAEEKPTRGKVFFDSMDMTTIPSGKLNQFRQRIGMIFPRLPPPAQQDRLRERSLRHAGCWEE